MYCMVTVTVCLNVIFFDKLFVVFTSSFTTENASASKVVSLIVVVVVVKNDDKIPDESRPNCGCDD